MMRFVNFVGSSHLSWKHGFPQTLDKVFADSDMSFKSKYCVKTVKSLPGATYYNKQLLESFKTTVQKQTSECGGQVNIVMLGSNDTREINKLPIVAHSEGLNEFYSKVNDLIGHLLSIPGSTVILPSVIIPESIYNVPTNRVLEEVVR